MESLQTLLRLGADLVATDSFGRQALIWAVVEGHCEAVNTLLAAGAVLESADCTGFTALHYAAKLGHADMCNVSLPPLYVLSAQSLMLIATYL